MICENKDLVEKYAHLPLNTPVIIRDSSGLAPRQGIGTIHYPTTSTGFANRNVQVGGTARFREADGLLLVHYIFPRMTYSYFLGLTEFSREFSCSSS